MLVNPHSIVRKIWGDADVVLFIFAGASAEFALNKAADWLFFTGKLPNDPVGRLFSTVSFAQQILFSEEEEAIRAIHKMNKIHAAVESARGRSIPNWAYKEVLDLLIFYSIAAYELLERRLTEAERGEVFKVFKRVGQDMNITDLPDALKDWERERERSLNTNLQFSVYTQKLYQSYKKHLGWFRYALLIEAQKVLLPKKALELLNFNQSAFMNLGAKSCQRIIKNCLKLNAEGSLLPKKFQDQFLQMGRLEMKCPVMGA